MNEKFREIKTELDEVRWFVELMNLNLESEQLDITPTSDSDLELHLLMFIARKVPVSGNKRLEEYELFDQVAKGEVTINDFITLQKNIGSIIEGIIKKSQEPVVREGTDWLAVERWKYGSGIIYKDDLPTKLTVEVGGLDFKGDRLITKRKTFLRWLPGKNKDRRVSVRMRSTNLVEYLFVRFLEVIDGALCIAFKQCPECHSHFIQPSKREKIYCSNKCASRLGSRRRRERLKAKNPGAYDEELKRGAERAWKSYKKRTKHGKPVRRPHKYKKEK